MTTATEQSALVIMAHPDDAEFGSAGTVAGWVKDGWEVRYIVCTDASGGGPDDATEITPESRAQITATRKAEQRAAAEILGVKEVIFLDYPDGQIEPTIALRRDLVRLIRRYRPTRVIVPSPDRMWIPQYMIPRYHPDHLAVGTAALAALYPAAQNPWDFPELLEEGLPPHKVRQFYIVGAPTNNHAVDISATIDIKLAALAAHVSQLGPDISELAARMREWATEAGKAHDLPMAELFHFAEQQ